MLLGANASILIERGDLQQRFPGIIIEVLEGEVTGDQISVHITVAPAAWLLSQRRDTRIFQDMSVPEILVFTLGDPLADFQREVRLELERDYPTREYTTQFDETDLDFAHRLLEEEGIIYRFDTTGETPTAPRAASR